MEYTDILCLKFTVVTQYCLCVCVLMFVMNQIKYHEDFEKSRMGGEAPYPESNANRGINQYMAAVISHFS